MMVKPTVKELLTKVDNRFELVIVTAKRARQIADGKEVLTDADEESPAAQELSRRAQQGSHRFCSPCGVCGRVGDIDGCVHFFPSGAD